MFISATPDGKWTAVCTVAEATQRLRRSERQVYRMLKSKTLVSLGKFGHEHLVSKDSVDRLAKCPATLQPLPKRMERFFPEYDVKKLNAGTDRALVILRLLEDGGMTEVRWLERRYRTKVIREIIAQHGRRQLSQKAFRFWGLYFNVPMESVAAPLRALASPWTRRYVKVA